MATRYCIKCGKPAWFDPTRGEYSLYCSNTCRLPVQNNIPFCSVCHNNQVYIDNNGNFSPYCSNTCRFSKPSKKIHNCIECGKNAWFDQQRGEYSPYCSITCQSKYSQVQNSKPLIEPPIAKQGQPMCCECNKIAFYDNRKEEYAPGCCLLHSKRAIKKGKYYPR